MKQDSKNLNISGHENAVDPDKVISKLSWELFELDKVSSTILEILGRSGPQNEYRIAKSVSYTSRYSVRRRINSPNGLLENDFIYESPGKKHRTNTVERFFGLTFKGFVASLSAMRLEENVLMKYHFTDLTKITKNPKIVELAIEYFRYDLALILLWHKINGLKLTSQKNTVSYFSYFDEHNLYDTLPLTWHKMTDTSIIDTYSNLRAQFLAIQISLARILKSIERNNNPLEPYNPSILDKKLYHYKSKSILYSAIKGWIASLQYVGYLYTKRVPEIIGSERGNIIKVGISESMSSDILNKLDFKFQKQPLMIL